LEMLPWVEIVVAVAVWLKPIERPALWVMTGLYFLFFVLAVYGNMIGRTLKRYFAESFKH